METDIDFKVKYLKEYIELFCGESEIREEILETLVLGAEASPHDVECAEAFLVGTLDVCFEKGEITERQFREIPELLGISKDRIVRMRTNSGANPFSGN